jgi:P-type Cu+ transporter
MEKTTLKIQGMDCASCSAIIEHDLKKTKGIISASINLASEKLYLEFNPAEIQIDTIKKNIKALGYKALDDMEGMDMAGMHEHGKMEKE